MAARSPPPKAWEPTRPSTPKRLANDWSSVRTPPSVASLARAELATSSAMHSIALSGGASNPFSVLYLMHIALASVTAWTMKCGWKVGG